ncbi:MAG: substrate-binding domain-containing protein [Kosmotoga sp.]|nr:MAG: substrate-binding domain-containing protein [Kosmotoga sp.]
MFGKKFTKLTVALLVTFLVFSSVSVMAANSKFREVPLDVIETMTKQFTAVLTPAGPNGEPVRGAEDLELTPDEIRAAKDLDLGEYYFMGASLDMTETLNRFGMNKILASIGKPEIKFMGSASIADQIDQVSTLAGKADQIGFVVAQAWEAVTLGPSFVELARAGVPQLHNWTTPKGLEDEEYYVGLVDADGYGQGVAAAEILAYAMGYKGEVGLIYFALEQWTNVMRLKGAEDTFAKYPDIKVVDRAGFTDPSESFDLAAAMLQRNPDLDAIWATWMMGPATGAAEAVISLNRVGDVVVAAPDLGGKAGATFIADPENPIIGGAEADCIEMGENSIRAAIKWLLGVKEIGQGYFVSRVYPAVRANLVEVYNKTNKEAIGELPQEVFDLLEQE